MIDWLEKSRRIAPSKDGSMVGLRLLQSNLRASHFIVPLAELWATWTKEVAGQAPREPSGGARLGYQLAQNDGGYDCRTHGVRLPAGLCPVDS